MELQGPYQTSNRPESLEPLASNASNAKEENEIRESEIRDIDPGVERRVRWKLDLTIMPLLTSVQFLANMVCLFLQVQWSDADIHTKAKSDLGNAEVAGLTEEMNLNAKEYSDLAIMITVGYLIFQIPGTMLIKKIGPPYQVSRTS